MLATLLPYITAISSLVAISGGVVGLVKGAKHFEYSRWTKQQEAHLADGGPHFKLQVLRKDRASLEWAVAHRRLRIAGKHSLGWYVVAETRLLPRGQ